MRQLKNPFPGAKKYAVCFTFDFDALSVWITTFGLKTPEYLSRGEFGGRVGVPRILNLLDKYKIKSTFFVPGHTAETFPEQVREIYKRGHEIGHHGYLHEDISKLSADEESKVLQKGISVLEQTVGERPRGYRSPSWEFSNNSARLLLDNGFAFDSSMMADDFTPYSCRHGDFVDEQGKFHRGQEIDLLEFPVSWSWDDWANFEHVPPPYGGTEGLRSIDDAFVNYKANFDFLRSNLQWGVWTMCFHPQVSGRGDRMVFLEKLITHFGQFDDVFFPRLIDVANYVQR